MSFRFPFWGFLESISFPPSPSPSSSTFPPLALYFCYIFSLVCQFTSRHARHDFYRAIRGQKNASPSSCVSIFLLSPMKKNTLEIIYDAYYASSAASSSSSSHSHLCYCIFRNRKGHLDHVCDKKIAFAFAFDIVLYIFMFAVVFFFLYYYCCGCCCSCYRVHTPETNCSQTTHESFDYRNFTYLNTLSLFKVLGLPASTDR